jgi:transposase
MTTSKARTGCKAALKTRIAAAQNGLCALTDAPLDLPVSLVDTDRIEPKANGGTYDHDDNVRIVLPRAHMARHGILRERETTLDELKALFDDRVQIMRLQLKINNQLLAYERRTDTAHPDTAAFLTEQLVPIHARLMQIDKSIERALKAYPDPVSRAAMRVKGLGPITVAALAVYVDLEKAATPSALWKYVGLHCASHQRYTKGEAGGGNKTLRTVLWNSANVMMKLGDGGYREVYDRTKARLAGSEKVVQTRNTQGKMVEAMWKDTKPSHRHGAALRAIIKHLLADYWLVGRTLKGLPTTPLYAESLLGHTHIIAPQERGWPAV